ncbi:MAG: alpha/beta hydrolase [Verrucomicrobiota bacterium]
MNPSNSSRFALRNSLASASRPIITAPRLWVALTALGVLCLGARAQTAGRPEDPLVSRNSSTRSVSSNAGDSATRADSVAGHRTEAGLPYRPDSEPDAYARERCRLDVHHPVGKQAFPTVVWFHGGGLTGGNRSIPSALKGQGIAVVAADYRLSPKAKAPAYIEDAAAAVAWTFRNIARYGGDTNRIFLSGHSAGGYLASLVTLDRRWLAVHGVDPDRLAGLVPFSGQSITHFTIREERGMARTRPVIDDLAPLYHVRKDAPPILLISGDRNHELLGRYEESAYFWRMLKEVGHPSVELLEVQGYDHGQMADPAFPLLLRFIRQHGK